MKEEGLPGGVSYRAATFLAITLGGLACLAIQLQLYAGNVTDAFHQGEYFSYYTAVRSGTFDGHALSLHGALDYLPAWVAHGLVGAGRYIFVTIVINGALQVAASIFFSLIAAAILRGSVHRYPLLIASALVGPLLLTSRDLLVLITTWLFIYVLTTPIAGWKKTFAEGALGVSFALGLYWSFDRGIAQTVAVGIPLVLAFLRDRRFQISILTAVVTAIALGSLVAAFSPVGYLQNIIFIAGTSSQFSYGWTRSALALTGAGLIFTIGALALLYLTARLRPPFGEPLMSLMFALLCACIFKTVSYRADFEHFPMMVWAPVLSLLFCVERLRDECGQRAVTLVALGCCAASALLVTEFWPAGPPVLLLVLYM